MAHIYYLNDYMSEMWVFLCLGSHKLVIIQEYDFIQGSSDPCNHTHM